MAKNKKGPKKSISLSREVKKIFEANPDYTYNYKQISSLLGIRDLSARKLIVGILEDLTDQEMLIQISRGKYQMKGGAILYSGHLQFILRGGAFFISEELDEDIYVHPSRTGKAFNKDKVKVRIIKFKGKSEGEVVELLDRHKKEFIGTVEKSGANFFLKLDDKTMPVDFFIERKHLNGAKDGEKVKVKLLTWPSTVKSPYAAVIDVLGDPGELKVEMESILSEFGFSSKFRPEVQREADLINEPNYNIEAKKRKDLRAVLTFTIDPHDAKDFDDALSYRVLKNGNVEVGVHIADVSHFILPNSELDKEAYLRGNSIYLVDRVVPMLPEKLSNKLCSLRPNEDKLTFSALFEIDNKCQVLNQWFGKTVIHSDYRFTYEQAQEIIEGKAHEIQKEINHLDKIAKQKRQERLNEGALNIESQEVKFKLDEQGNPIDIILKTSKDAHKLIEEFMLLANKKVATKIGKPEKNKKIVPFIYRIHDQPNPEKISDLKIFLEQFDYQIIKEKNKPISSSLNKVMQKAKLNDELHIIGPMVIRSMSKAIYSIENVGHYGLAFNYYSHFTSPIRRYADLLIHRILEDILNGKSYSNNSALEQQCKHISTTEKEAVEAERASTKYMQVVFLKDKVGETFSGKINGLTDWGFYVELNDNKCEGLVQINSLPNDHFYFDHELKKIIGHKTKESFSIGQEVQVVVKRTNLQKRQIDFILFE
jgi:ribonuclease R